MSRQKLCRLVFYFDPDTMAEAAQYLQIKRKCDVVLAAIFMRIERELGPQNGLPIFINRHDPDWLESAQRALMAGFTVALEHRGRLRKYRPGTIAGERLRQMLVKNK